MNRPLCIGLLFGGVGPEHEASLSSAWAILQNLDNSRYRTKLFGARKDGTWLIGDGAWSQLYRLADRALLPSDIVNQAPAEAATQCFDSLLMSELRGIDCAFPVIHGTGGEDGALQGLLSLAGVPFAGSGVLGSVQAYDKWTAKQIVRAAGVPVTPALRIARDEPAEQVRARIAAELGCWNLVIKPVASGSSFGVSRISSPASLSEALELAFTYDDAALVEPYVRHQELFVGVLGDALKPLVASPVLDPDPKDSPSTYRDKYIDDHYPLQYPANLGSVIEQRSRDMASTVFKALGCSGYARVDLFLCHDTGELTFNEINTIPALAVDCAFALGMRGEGWCYTALVDEIIAQALIPSSHPSAIKKAPAGQNADAMTILA